MEAVGGAWGSAGAPPRRGREGGGRTRKSLGRPRDLSGTSTLSAERAYGSSSSSPTPRGSEYLKALAVFPVTLCSSVSFHVQARGVARALPPLMHVLCTHCPPFPFPRGSRAALPSEPSGFPAPSNGVSTSTGPFL